jgi:3-oxoacyl-[acyl-carrier protein] reductase
MICKKIFGLEEKVALVTGSTKGLGRAIAIKFAEAGCRRIVVNASSPKSEMVESLLKELEVLGAQGIYIRADVSNKKEVVKLFKEAVEKFGKVDILVNNAGVLNPKTSFIDIPEEYWDTTMDVNLKGTFLCLQEGIRIMLENGNGAVVNISSTAGVTGGSVGPQYGASKAGMIALTKSTSKMYADKGIRINAVVPGDIRTEMLENITKDPEAYKKRTSIIPMKRFCEPEEIANTVLFLATPMSSFSTGAIVHATGGRV